MDGGRTDKHRLSIIWSYRVAPPWPKIERDKDGLMDRRSVTLVKMDHFKGRLRPTKTRFPTWHDFEQNHYNRNIKPTKVVVAAVRGPEFCLVGSHEGESWSLHSNGLRRASSERGAKWISHPVGSLLRQSYARRPDTAPPIWEFSWFLTPSSVRLRHPRLANQMTWILSKIQSLASSNSRHCNEGKGWSRSWSRTD